MIYFMFFILLCLLAFSYCFAGKDFFTPATVQIMSFAFSVAMCIYWMRFINVWHEFHWGTIAIIASGMCFSAVVGVVVHWLFMNINVARAKDYETTSPIPMSACLLMMCFIVAVICWQLAEIVRIAGEHDSFYKMMNVFRGRSSWSANDKYRFPLLLRVCINFIQAIFIVTGFNFISFYSRLSRWSKMANFAVMALCALNSLLVAGRTSTVNILIGLAVFYNLLRIRRMHGFFRYSFWVIVKIALCLCVMLYSFVLVKHFVGRRGTMADLPVLGYVAFYTGVEPIVLDQYLQTPPPPDFIGKYSFYDLIRNLITLGVITHQPYVVHLEMRPVGGEGKTNVYSFFRIYHYEYGLLGMFVLHALMIITMSALYEYTKKRLSDRWILFFGSIYYSVVMSFFADRFYSTLFSFSFLLKLCEICLLYETLLKKRFRFVLKSVGARLSAAVE